MYSFLLVFFSNFVPKTHCFWDTRLLSIQWPWNRGWGSLKVIKNFTVQSGTHDLLLTFHSNHQPISYGFRDKRRYPSKVTRKSPIFPTPMYLNPPLKRFLCNCVSVQGSHETRMMGLSDGRKSFQIGLAVLIQYRRVTDTQPASHPPTQTRFLSKYRAYCVAQVTRQEAQLMLTNPHDAFTAGMVSY